MDATKLCNQMDDNTEGVTKEELYKKNYLSPNLENTSHDHLFDFTKRESLKKINQTNKPLIEKLINKISPLNKSIISNQLNNSNTYHRDVNDKNIDFQDNKKSLIKEDNKKRKSSTSSKKARKSSLMVYIEKNPLAFIESLKKLEEHTSNHGITLLKIKYCDIFLGLSSILSMLFAIIDNELYASNSLKFLNNKIEELKKEVWTFEILKQIKDRKISETENTLRTFNIIISSISCVILIFKYNYQIYISKLDKRISEYDGLFSSRLIFWLILECVITIIFYPPYLNIVFFGNRINIVYAYSLNAIFLPLNAIKLYNVFRLIMLFSRYNTRISQTICQSHKTSSGITFVIKSEINSKKLLIITCTVLFLCVFVTAIIRDFECLSFDKHTFLEGKKGLNDLQNYMNNLWLILITLTNVGYGDEYPRTLFGRIIIFFISFLGLLGLGIVIATLSEKLEFTQNEKKAYLRLKKIFDPENLQHKSGNIIKTILLMARNIKLRGGIGEERSANLKEKICLLLKIRAETRCFINELHVSRVYSMPLNDIVKTLETKLYDNLVDITKDLENINMIENDFKLLEENQIYIQEKLKKINYLQIEIGKYLLEKQNYNYLHKDKNSEKNLDINYSKEKEIPNIEKISSNPYILNDIEESKKKKKKKAIKTFFKQRSVRSLKSRNNLIENKDLIIKGKGKRYLIKTKKKDKLKKLGFFKLVNVEKKRTKSLKILSKLTLTENEKIKTKKKKNQIEKTTIPFLDLNNTKKTIDGSSFNENQNN